MMIHGTSTLVTTTSSLQVITSFPTFSLLDQSIIIMSSKEEATGRAKSSATRTVETKTIQLPKSGKQAIIVSLNRPSKQNCFDTKVVHTLSRIFHDIATQTSQPTDETNNVSCIIFTGKGKTFCAGADLSNPPNPIVQSSYLPECLVINPVHQMSLIPLPIIGALHGHVITGGFELALACDVLVGDTTTKFRDTHVKFGLAPCWGLSQKLQRRIGPGRAKLLSFTARPLDAKTAHEWGLLDELVEEEEEGGMASLKRAIEIADVIGMQDLTMVKRYKQALEEGGKMDLDKGLHRERELGLAHYITIMNDGSTFENAKEYIQDEKRPRLQSKL
jgi:enoyl-CoA hydratase